MIFGVRAHDYGRRAPQELFSAIAADGWRCVQLALKKSVAGVESLGDITPQRIEEVGRALAGSGLSVGVLGCYVEPGLADEALRRRSVEEFIVQTGFAAALGAACIGTETTPLARQPGVSRREALLALERSLAEILPEAEARGVTVAIEPVYSHTMDTPECTAQVLADLRSDRLRVIFDPVNLLTPQAAGDQRGLWERAFQCFGDRIAAVHMKGVRIAGDAQVPCGFTESVVDYRYLFGELRKLPGEIPVLREEADPREAASDLAFLSALA